MVVCKDRLDRIHAADRMGVDAVVEDDIVAVLSGKSYEELLSLQRQIQFKLTGGEPVDTDYWEGLLQRLLVWKAKVHIWVLQRVASKHRCRQSYEAYTKLWSEIDWNNCVNVNETKQYRLRKSCLQALLNLHRLEGGVNQQTSKMLLLKTLRSMIAL